jgi:endonuclease/exonuclease/phosphatase (EEP) superfamily protein YafD
VERISRVVLLPTCALLIACLASMSLPMRDWVAGLVRSFAPWTALAFVPALLVAVPALPLARGRWAPRLLAIVSVAGILLVLVRFPLAGGGHRTLPADATPLRVATWNLLVGNVPADDLATAVLDHQVDILALEELTPSVAAALDQDPAIRARYPWRVLHPTESWDGMGVLSSFPLVEAPDPDAVAPMIGAEVTLPDGQVARLVAYHAPPPQWGIALPGGVRYDPSRRDAAIVRLGDHVRELLATGDHVLVMGDLNLTPNEVAYDELIASGLVDAHVVAGEGLGGTWRPQRLMDTGIAVLRIDHILVSPDVAVGLVDVDCTPHGSDHCLVTALIGVGSAAKAEAEAEAEAG